MFTFPSSDGLEIHVHEWQPSGKARGVVQLAHGMGEHAARYAHLAELLIEHGYAVYGNDHRGHGLTMKGEPGHLGENGWNLLVSDMIALTRLLRDRHPGLPVILVAHSMGSFAAQQYILDHADLLAGVALSGTTATDKLIELSMAADGDLLAFYNAGFQPNRTDADWLSRDESQVDAYIADPLCGFSVDDQAAMEMIAAVPRLMAPLTVPTSLPLYVAVGDRDPINGGLAYSDLLIERYRAAGLTDITYQTYPGARHEILNETNRQEVEADLLAWLTRVTG